MRHRATFRTSFAQRLQRPSLSISMSSTYDHRPPPCHYCRWPRSLKGIIVESIRPGSPSAATNHRAVITVRPVSTICHEPGLWWRYWLPCETSLSDLNTPYVDRSIPSQPARELQRASSSLLLISASPLRCFCKRMNSLKCIQGLAGSISWRFLFP